MTEISHRQPTQTLPALSADHDVALPFIPECYHSALERLGTAFSEARPVATLIGEGKTAASFVSRCFLDNIGDDVAVARVTASSTNADAAMREIIRGVGTDPKDTPSADLEDVFTMFLSLQLVRQRRTIIGIEDAQDIGPWVLDWVQRLVELETEANYGLMIILSGQTSVIDLLEESSLRALETEQVQYILLAPFTLADTKEYVRRRTAATATTSSRKLFDFDAINLIHEISDGVADAISDLYSRCVLVAENESTDTVSVDIVRQAEELLQQGGTVELPYIETPSPKRNGASAPRGRLIARMDGDLISKRVLRKGHTLIGRSNVCHIRLQPHEISRHHALVINSPHGTDLIDLRSTNGTFVDGRPIKQCSLRNGDAIRIGSCIIEYVSDD